MKNNKGIAEIMLLYFVIAGLALLFVPNPLSTAFGVGVRPNKTVQTEKVELIKDSRGVPIAYRTVLSEQDIQQHIGFWEWLRSLPVLAVMLMGLGVVFPPLALFLHNLWTALKSNTKQIVVGVDKALTKVNDPALKQVLYDEMEKVQDISTKNLVDKIQGKK